MDFVWTTRWMFLAIGRCTLASLNRAAGALFELKVLKHVPNAMNEVRRRFYHSRRHTGNGDGHGAL
jgi:hypothetical protein